MVPPLIFFGFPAYWLAISGDGNRRDQSRISVAAR